ncbi:hypothetical protein K1719_009357 [Acacia pycnantha]|nr:hypothetical protein K1719_009357 [Acacia pycnantha]
MKSLRRAPGPDGLHALFFQSQWDVISPSLFKMITDIFNGGYFDPALNHTLIALIQHLLPPNINLHIAAPPQETPNEDMDICFWNLTPNGSFTVASAYHEEQHL